MRRSFTKCINTNSYDVFLLLGMRRSVRGCQGSWRGGDCWLLPQPPDGVSLGRRAHSSLYERALQVALMIFCLAAHCVLNQLVPGLSPVHTAYPPNYAPLHLLKLIFMEKTENHCISRCVKIHCELLKHVFPDQYRLVLTRRSTNPRSSRRKC